MCFGCAGVPGPLRKQGLWLGDIPLCSDTVTGLVNEPALGGDGTTLMVELTPEAGARFTKLTTRFVGEQLPISFNGEVVQAPYINEPIRGGRLAIAGLGVEEIERISAAAMARCPAPTRYAPAHA